MTVRGCSGAGMAVRWAICMVALGSVVSGCFLRDPLDPHGELNHRVVANLGDAEQMARGREAFDRARGRAANVQSGMSVAEVETAMQAIVIAQGHGDATDKEAPRRKFVEGLLCRYQPAPLRQRWLFGYDEAGVELVGFVFEFSRNDPDSEKWTVRSIDRHPTDDCPDSGE